MKRKAFLIPLAIVAGIGLISLYVWATQSLWNWLIPDIFNGPVISFGQTAGLMLLVCMFSWIAIGGKHKPSPEAKMRWRNKWKTKWQHGWSEDWCRMSEDERMEWRRRFRGGDTPGNNAGHGEQQQG